MEPKQSLRTDRAGLVNSGFPDDPSYVDVPLACHEPVGLAGRGMGTGDSKISHVALQLQALLSWAWAQG